MVQGPELGRHLPVPGAYTPAACTSAAARTCVLGRKRVGVAVLTHTSSPSLPHYPRHLQPAAPFLPVVRDDKDTSNFDAYPESDSEKSGGGGGGSRAAGGDGDTAGRLTAKDAELFAEFDSY